MFKITGTILVILAIAACEGQKQENPTPPEVAEITGGAAPQEEQSSDQVAAEAPDEQQPVAEQPAEPAPEDLPAGEPAPETEGTQLAVVAIDQLPQRIADCVNQGVAGEVIDGSFTCNQQGLIDCNSLSEGQKQVAKSYADENLPGFSLYGCSLNAQEEPNLHYFLVEGAALRIFNLQVQRSVPVE